MNTRRSGSGLRCRGTSNVVVATVFGHAIACAAPDASVIKTGAPAGSDDSGTSTDHADTAADSAASHEKASIRVWVAIDGVVLDAVGADGAFEWMGGPFSADSLVIHDVVSGSWSVLAHDSGQTACNRSESFDLGPGEVFEWTVESLPGAFDSATGDCVGI